MVLYEFVAAKINNLYRTHNFWPLFFVKRRFGAETWKSFAYNSPCAVSYLNDFCTFLLQKSTRFFQIIRNFAPTNKLLKTIMKLLITILLSLVAVSSTKAGNTINNDTFWKTTSGSYIYSQGGGIFRFPDAQGVEHYYWYGAKYQEAVDYCPKALAGSKSNVTNFLAVTCYQSDDLVNWTFVRNVLTPEAAGWAYWVGRMGVAYIPEAKKYALLTQFNDHVLVATCSTPTGNYARHNEIDMTNMIGTPNTGDMTVFTDPDTGKSYLCYSYGKGRAKIYLSEIGVLSNGKIGLKDCHQIFKGAGREGDCMFKYKNKYYVCASDLYGWNASNVYYLEASSIYGPYTPTNNMQIMPGSADDYGHVTQTGFFYTVRGSKQETVIYCGDRWAGFAGNGKGYNQWCPISFVDGKPYFNSLSQWHLDAETGEWWVGDDNNYVRNHFFNADRVKIPSSNKPSQADLKGWKTTVIKGNKVVIGGTDSPVLNASNSSADREVVTGNYCLNIQDKVDFTRKVSQTVKSTPVVELKDGRYTLRCYVKSGSQFDELYMYAKVGNDTTRIDMPYSDSKWHEVIIENLQVSGGQVEVGFYADGKANAWCHIDEVSLVRKGDHGETNGISTIPTGQTTSQSNNRLYYNLSGTPSLQPYPGINIVRETINGTSKSYKIIRP
jgi:hypothetical protein